MLPVWWTVGSSYIPDTLFDNKEFKYRLRLADCETFYDIRTANDLADFLVEFHKDRKEFNLGYDIRNVTLKDPYDDRCRPIDNLAEFAVQKYNANHEPLRFKAILRIFSFDYFLKSNPGSLWEAYFISFTAEDKDGTSDLYHANVLKSEGLENLLLDFRVSRFFPGDFVKGEDLSPCCLDLFRKRRMYVEPDISFKVVNWSEKEVQLITTPVCLDVTGNTGGYKGKVVSSTSSASGKKEVQLIKTPECLDVTGNTGGYKGKVGSSTSSASGKLLTKRKRKRKQGKPLVSKRMCQVHAA